MENNIAEIVALVLSVLGVSGGVTGAVALRTLRRRAQAFFARSKVPVTILAHKDALDGAQKLEKALKADAIPHVSVTCRPEAVGQAKVVVVYRPDGVSANTLISDVREFAPTAIVLVLFAGRLGLAPDNFAAIHLSNSELRLWGDVQAATSRIGVEL